MRTQWRYATNKPTDGFTTASEGLREADTNVQCALCMYMYSRWPAAVCRWFCVTRYLSHLYMLLSLAGSADFSLYLSLFWLS